MNRNIDTVNRVYAAFGRGDVDAILAEITPDTRWGFNVEADDIPWHHPAEGPDGVRAFFAAMPASVAFERFAPADVLTGADTVAVRVSMRYRVLRTGKVVDQDQVHLWRFAADGRIAGMVHFEDTAQVRAAYAS